MLLRRTLSSRLPHYLPKKFFHKSYRLSKREDFENPIERTFKVLTNNVKDTYKRFVNAGSNEVMSHSSFPTHSDVVVIGGGAIGSSISYWLKEKSNADSFSVIVIEKDLTYSQCSTCLSVGGLRQQFSLPENIQMSLYGAEFLRTLKHRFGPHADVCFTPHGYLLLASETGAEQLIENSRLQNDLGAKNCILGRQQLKERFPWMNVEDVEIGCLGLEKEGWFDPWSLLQLIKEGAASKGAGFVNGEVIDFKFDNREDIIVDGITQSSVEMPRSVVVKTPDGEERSIHFSLCVIAAGPDSGKLAEKLKIGTGEGLLAFPLPVERRKRYVFSFDCEKNPPGLNTPMTIDTTGAYFRRDGLGGRFLCGISPEENDEPATDNLDVNYEFFDTHLWPIIANRVPAFNAVKVKGAWGGFYEYNRFDENGIVGPHPHYNNIYIATGFSGHGIQQSPAIGRAVAELILDGRFQTIDLTRLGFDRVLLELPLLESRIF
ncbi:FAD-dependent oxidoreductase domain-containing protein 1-like [Anthonomus grandis grandis]|uniref:FAD-dependent oxidoreductase domain-containing protein 1-like n=1 Tax=Anthonomus grandis grandis TaxID=2921223 RepID=UPI002165AE26|nr:FAD-dependent oxidoreductase domain-containing protein 1-like [Anthonomus grandis grandis]